ANSYPYQRARAAASMSPSTFIEPQALEQLNSVAIKIKRCFQQGWVVLLLFWRTRLEVRLRTGTAAYWCGFKRSVDGLQPPALHRHPLGHGRSPPLSGETPRRRRSLDRIPKLIGR